MLRSCLVLAVVFGAASALAEREVLVAAAPRSESAPPPAEAFSPPPDGRLNAPEAPDQVAWALVQIAEPKAAGHLRFVEVEGPTAARVTFLVYDDDGERRVDLDPLEPYTEREIQSALPTVAVRLDARGGARVLIRVGDPAPYSFPVAVRAPAEQVAASLSRGTIYGVGLGFALLIFLYNVLIYAVRREREFLAYCLYLAPCIAITVVSTGLAGALGISPLWAQLALQPLGSLIGIAAIHFVQVFLQTKDRWPRLHLALQVAKYGTLVQTLSVFMLPEPLAFASSLFATVGGVALLLFAIVYALVVDPRGTAFFAVAWGTMLLSILVALAAMFGDLLPLNAFTENAMLIGQSLEYALLALAVADRVNRIKEERLEKALEVARFSSTFERYVPKQFVAQLEKPSILDVGRGDHVRQDMTVFFSDVRGFTSLSERLTPEEVFRLINDYLAAMAPDIEREGGFIDKYIGDAIMALFPDGDPLAAPGLSAGADGAVRAAVANLRRLEALNAGAAEPISIGVGLHTGEVTLGMVGSDERLNATVLGDAVNLASRVEGLTKRYGAHILITEATRARLVGRYGIRAVDRVRVKGKAQPVAVYEVFEGTSLAAEKAETAPGFEAALAAYQRGDLTLAREGFEAVLARFDDPVARLYLERCDRFLAEGLPPSWDGVETLDQK